MEKNKIKSDPFPKWWLIPAGILTFLTGIVLPIYWSMNFFDAEKLGEGSALFYTITMSVLGFCVCIPLSLILWLGVGVLIQTIIDKIKDKPESPAQKKNKQPKKTKTTANANLDIFSIVQSAHKKMSSDFVEDELGSSKEAITENINALLKACGFSTSKRNIEKVYFANILFQSSQGHLQELGVAGLVDQEALLDHCLGLYDRHGLSIGAGTYLEELNAFINKP